MRQEKGFTLVELSIVLVIIGLLIGGILVAQSMIDTARITAQIKQFQQLDAATQNFITSYKYMPGDCPICGTPAGNGDGMLEDIETNGFGSDPNQCQGMLNRDTNEECLPFWKHMASMNMIAYSNEYTSQIPNGSVNPSHHWAYQGDGWNLWSEPQLSISNRPQPIDAAWTINGGLYWTGTLVNVAKQPFTNIQAMAIDAKIDDGVGDTGNVRAAGSGAPTTNDFIIPQATGSDVACTTFGGGANSCCYTSTTPSHYIATAGTTCGLQVKANVYTN